MQLRVRPLLATQQAAIYKRHRPENTLLYQLVERHYPEFKEALLGHGKQLPKFIEREFDDFLRCGRLENGFLRVVCDDCKHENLLLLVASAAVSVRVAELEEWLKAQRFW